MVKTIKLTGSEITILREIEDVNRISKFIDDSAFDVKTNCWIFLLGGNDIEFISDELFRLIQNKGISNGEINSYGIQVDNLVDKFNHYE